MEISKYVCFSPKIHLKTENSNKTNRLIDVARQKEKYEKASHTGKFYRQQTSSETKTNIFQDYDYKTSEEAPNVDVVLRPRIIMRLLLKSSFFELHEPVLHNSE